MATPLFIFAKLYDVRGRVGLSFHRASLGIFIHKKGAK